LCTFRTIIFESTAFLFKIDSMNTFPEAKNTIKTSLIARRLCCRAMREVLFSGQPSTGQKTKLFLVAAYLLFLGADSLAQPSFWFKRQSQVDSFQILYPGIEEVGTLVLGYIQFDTTKSDIHDLAPFSNLKKIWGDLYVRHNPRLKNLHGLENVDTIATAIHSYIYENDSLENLQGLNNLRYMGGFSGIYGNPRLQTLAGLENLEYVVDFNISNNASLQNVDALLSLKEARGSFGISYNGVQSVNLPSLKKVEYLVIRNEPYLTSLAGLANLDSIGSSGNFSSGHIFLIELPSITSLEGLENIVIAPRVDVWIEGNPALMQLELLETMQSDSLGDVHINKNNLLETIFCNSLKNARIIEIINNASLQSVAFPILKTINTPYDAGGMYIVDNGSLKDISFPSLEYTAGGLNNDLSIWVENNDALEDMGTWSDSLVVGGDLQINWNAKLKSLDGMEGLRSTGKRFSVDGNDILQTLCSFMYFDSIGADLSIFGNPMLTSLHGLETLEFVGKGVSLYKDSLLTDIQAIAGIDSIGWNVPFSQFWSYGGIGVGDCHFLEKIDFSGSATELYQQNFNGFSNCTRLETINIPYIEQTHGFYIEGNSALASFSFPTIQSIGGDAPDNYHSWIINNPSLTTLDGLNTIATITLADDFIYIQGNPLLTDCEAICRAIDRGVLPWRFQLANNAFPCNSYIEVQEHICDTLTFVQHEAAPSSIGASLLTMPNPTQGVFHVQLPDGQVVQHIAMYDMAGRGVYAGLAGFGNGDYNISELTAGLYLVHVFDQNGRLYQGKLMKK
jgi:Secretion system C-terminal sorting domain